MKYCWISCLFLILISWLVLMIPFIGLILLKKPRKVVKAERIYEEFHITDKLNKYQSGTY